MRSVMMLMLLLSVSAFAQDELSAAQQWAIALTGIITVVNNDSLTTLTNREPSPEAKDVYVTILNRDWGITSRSDLSTMIYSLAQHGHHESFAKLMVVINATSDYSYENLSSTYGLSDTDYNRVLFILKNGDLYKNRSLLGWDLGRAVALCRWGVDSGYISEAEAWPVIMHLAGIIQSAYPSWESYGSDYVLGRAFWASSFGKGEEYLSSTLPILLQLVGKDGVWTQLPWYMTLDAGKGGA